MIASLVPGQNGRHVPRSVLEVQRLGPDLRNGNHLLVVQLAPHLQTHLCATLTDASPNARRTNMKLLLPLEMKIASARSLLFVLNHNLKPRPRLNRRIGFARLLPPVRLVSMKSNAQVTSTIVNVVHLHLAQMQNIRKFQDRQFKTTSVFR
jgi:hypothetical protein